MMAALRFLSAAGHRFRALLRFIRVALNHASGPLIVVAALLGSARAATILLSGWIRGDVEPVTTLYRLVPSEITAACMLVAVLMAEQCARHGARRLTAYALAVVVAAILAGLASTPLVLFMHDRGVPMGRTYIELGTLGTVLYYSADALARGGLAACIFATRESFLGSLAQLRAAQLKRAHTERDLANARFFAMEAMMQPEALVSGLNAVRTLYDGDRAAADDRLAALIEKLRLVSVQIKE